MNNRLNHWAKKQWLKVGLVFSLITLVMLLTIGRTWDVSLQLTFALSALIPVHAMEEWLFPGGFAFQYNRFLYHSDQPKRYPMNRVSDMITVLGTTVLYGVIAVFFLPQGSVPVGVLLSILGFSLLEIGVHTYLGISAYQAYHDKGKTSFYSVGSLSAYTGFGGLSIWTLLTLLGQSIQFLDILVGLVLLGAIALLCIVPEKVFLDTKSPYDFAFPNYYDQFTK